METRSHLPESRENEHDTGNCKGGDSTLGMNTNNSNKTKGRLGEGDVTM